MGLFGDGAIDAVEAALSGVSERQKVIANNIANVAVPGFKASRVSFEDSLRSAIARGEPGRMTVSLDPANTPERIDGNNVALEEETTDLIKAGLHYDALVEALNFKLGLYRVAIGRR